MKQFATAAGPSKHPDHEVIIPPNRLEKAMTLNALASDDPIARAEAALSELSGEFSGWMRTECDRLDAARQAAKRDGMSGKARDDVFRAAHDIKGHAATFGYPLASEVAESLCRIIEHSPDAARIPAVLIDQHVDAVRAIIREDARQAESQLAATLVQSLREIADEFLLNENRHRPDYLDGIVAPPPTRKA
jgi:chemotaxis protein histidine kinase CheA